MEKLIRKPIIRDGHVIGWKLYKTGGIFGALTWAGYDWYGKTPPAPAAGDPKP